MSQVKIYVSQKDQWLIDSLNTIVKKKKEMGFQSSFSFEFVRCAKNGLTNGMIGSELDKKLLMGERNDDNPE